MPSLSRELVDHAFWLAKREPKRPKQASLRRSVSTSYYALFHFLAEESSKLAVGGAQSRLGLRQLTARSFVHGKLKDTCLEFQKGTPKAVLKMLWSTLKPDTNADLQTVASTFVQLQEERHDADYDLTRKFTRGDAILAANQARDAMAAWGRLKSAQPELALFFALSLMIWPGLSGR